MIRSSLKLQEHSLYACTRYRQKGVRAETFLRPIFRGPKLSIYVAIASLIEFQTGSRVNHDFWGALTSLTSGGSNTVCINSDPRCTKCRLLNGTCIAEIIPRVRIGLLQTVVMTCHLSEKGLCCSGLSLPKSAKTFMGGMHLRPPKGKC